MERISIEAAYTGTTVLLTGGSGYVGSVVLEALLRKTRAARVYVLLRRSKDGKTAASRLASLLDRPLFHALRSTRRIDDAVALDGDLTAPRLGLSDADAAVLQREVSIILHAAADIRLELPIHDALTTNVIGTRAVLALGRSCSSLRAFVHVSSCFVNVHQPAGSVVDERLYQLGKGTSGLDAAAVVDDLLALPPDAAELRATALRGRWGFPNNYTLSKHLAESHVAAAAAAAGSCDCRDLPEGAAAVIVRPSLVTAVLYDPLPGAIGNFAGPIGASAALAMGFYHSLRCVSSRPLHVWDVVPADIVANGIIAAGAAAATDGAARALAQSAAAAVSGLPAAAALPLPPPPLLIVQSSSSATWPLTLLEGWNAAADFIAAHPPRTRLSLGAPPTMTATFLPNPAAVAWHRRWTAFKVAAASMLLRLLGRPRAAARLTNGFQALCVYGTSKTDRDLTFSSHALAALEAALSNTEQRAWPLVMRPGMPLPRTVRSSDNRGGDTWPLLQQQQQQQDGVLTWRRYLHTQMAAVYSSLFHATVPSVAPGVRCGGAMIQHDFVLVK